MAITRSDITGDLRTRYDLGDTDKTEKLDNYIDETIRDISNQLPGALNVRSGLFDVTADNEIILDSNVDQVILAYYNNTEIPILGISDLVTWQQENFFNQYALAMKLDEDSGNFILTTNGLGQGASVTLVYTVRVSNIAHFPSTFRNLLFYGAAYKYEKYELRLLPQEYKVTFGEYESRLTLMQNKQFNQMQLTKQMGGNNFVERLKEVL